MQKYLIEWAGELFEGIIVDPSTYNKISPEELGTYTFGLYWKMDSFYSREQHEFEWDKTSHNPGWKVKEHHQFYCRDMEVLFMRKI